MPGDREACEIFSQSDGLSGCSGRTCRADLIGCNGRSAWAKLFLDGDGAVAANRRCWHWQSLRAGKAVMAGPRACHRCDLAKQPSLNHAMSNSTVCSDCSPPLSNSRPSARCGSIVASTVVNPTACDESRCCSDGNCCSGPPACDAMSDCRGPDCRNHKTRLSNLDQESSPGGNTPGRACISWHAKRIRHQEE